MKIDTKRTQLSLVAELHYLTEGNTMKTLLTAIAIFASTSALASEFCGYAVSEIIDNQVYGFETDDKEIIQFNILTENTKFAQILKEGVDYKGADEGLRICVQGEFTDEKGITLEATDVFFSEAE